MSDGKTKAQKLARLRHIATSDDRFFIDYTSEIEEYLDDKDPEVRALAVECLWEYPDPAYIDVLMDLAEHDPDEQVREYAISGLGVYIYEGEYADYDFDWGEHTEIMREDELPQSDFERVRDYLLAVVRDAARPINARRRAIEAISFLHEPVVIDIIEEAYHHPDKKMKISAVFAMGRNASAKWEKYILEALDSPVPEIEYEAVCAAGSLALDHATRPLMRIATESEDKNLRIAAIRALGEIGHEMAFPLLDDLQFDPDRDIRKAAEEALDEWMMSAHLRELDDTDLLDLDDDLDDFDWNGDGWLN
ncbi:MAG: HEAT repeat domain-containing protein [Chloroflexi bacterium]|nr:MAG: HEAT repeat domain-containing protein [Chloroflexota bacterium]